MRYPVDFVVSIPSSLVSVFSSPYFLFSELAASSASLQPERRPLAIRIYFFQPVASHQSRISP
jgi:hypothetical protein